MRKGILLPILIFLFSSCEPQYAIKKVDVIYMNGENETITVKYDEMLSSSGIFFHDNCIYLSHEHTRYDAPYQNCVVCGVRKFKIN